MCVSYERILNLFNAAVYDTDLNTYLSWCARLGSVACVLYKRILNAYNAAVYNTYVSTPFSERARCREHSVFVTRQNPGLINFYSVKSREALRMST